MPWEMLDWLPTMSLQSVLIAFGLGVLIGVWRAALAPPPKDD